MKIMKLTYRNRRIEDEHGRPMLAFSMNARRDNPPQVIDRLGQLLAEAPELLEALERSLEWLESARRDQPEDFDCSALDDVISQARSVISKAKGQP